MEAFQSSGDWILCCRQRTGGRQVTAMSRWLQTERLDYLILQKRSKRTINTANWLYKRTKLSESWWTSWNLEVWQLILSSVNHCLTLDWQPKSKIWKNSWLCCHWAAVEREKVQQLEHSLPFNLSGWKMGIEQQNSCIKLLSKSELKILNIDIVIQNCSKSVTSHLSTSGVLPFALSWSKGCSINILPLHLKFQHKL